MADVTTNVVLEYLQVVEQPDPRLPKARWFIYGSVAGDGTGVGIMVINMAIRASTTGRTLDLFSVEGISAQFNTGGADRKLSVLLSGYEAIVNGTAVFSRHFFNMIGMANLGVAIIDIRTPISKLLPIVRQRAGATLNLQFVQDNQSGALTLEANAWGYVWDGDADRLGGPTRPHE